MKYGKLIDPQIVSIGSGHPYERNDIRCSGTFHGRVDGTESDVHYALDRFH